MRRYFDADRDNLHDPLLTLGVIGPGGIPWKCKALLDVDNHALEDQPNLHHQYNNLVEAETPRDRNAGAHRRVI